MENPQLLLDESLFASEDDRFVFYLMEYIRKNSYKPGARLPSVRSLATTMGISQSQVRSGFLRAASYGLITIVSRSGCYVNKFDFNHLISIFTLLFEYLKLSDTESLPLVDVYDVKTMLERGIAKRVASIRMIEEVPRLKNVLDKLSSVQTVSEMILCDEEFHNTIAKISKNSLAIVLTDVIQKILRSSRMEDPEYFGTLPQVIEDHTQLYLAIKEQDAELAAMKAEIHSNRKKNRLLNRILNG